MEKDNEHRKEHLMATSFVLLSAMPPTLGHADLINFAAALGDSTKVVHVLREGEPYRQERLQSLRDRFAGDPSVEVLPLEIPAWDEAVGETNLEWADFLRSKGFEPGDLLVVSEPWGAEIAGYLGGEFFPYDMERTIRYTKATGIRENLADNWGWVIPEFQRLIQKRIVIFGAESTGKSTLARAIRDALKNTIAVPEYARGYLENTPGELNDPKMRGIWRGQKALQQGLQAMDPVPQAVILDTDLYSTLGYWEFWSPETVPAGLKEDADELRADLYLFLDSSIPFETDPIRYGGDHREQSDDYWRSVLRAHELPFVELSKSTVQGRLSEALEAIDGIVPRVINHRRLE